ncbi:hypothetical protein D3C72_2278790 [compost metagenome]
MVHLLQLGQWRAFGQQQQGALAQIQAARARGKLLVGFGRLVQQHGETVDP